MTENQSQTLNEPKFAYLVFVADSVYGITADRVKVIFTIGNTEYLLIKDIQVCIGTSRIIKHRTDLKTTEMVSNQHFISELLLHYENLPNEVISALKEMGNDPLPFPSPKKGMIDLFNLEGGEK